MSRTVVNSDWYLFESSTLPTGVMGMAWLHPDDGTPMVSYSSDLTDKERRLTIAHEIAHLVFDRGCGRTRTTEMEERADRFAAELVSLMRPAKRRVKRKRK
ncbi:MAG: ImmA/IrrE family metallo-endopeptidase [Proteobacteria bacterium]|nr:ImmA/IrrE family metallo-endopeptidase [Pseudomonadota bacterium]